MALTEDQRNEVKGMIYEELPCATNKMCKEVHELREQIKKIDMRTWVILVSIIIGTLIQIALKF